MIYSEVIEDFFTEIFVPMRCPSGRAEALSCLCEHEEWLKEHLEGESKKHLIGLLNAPILPYR